MVRECFNDWNRERLSDMRIELIDEEPSGSINLTEHDVVERLEGSLRFMRHCFDRLTFPHMKVLHQVGVNAFEVWTASDNSFGVPVNAGYVAAAYDLAADEALTIETEIPEGVRYWSVQLGDMWSQALDYVYHQTSLNGAQSRLSPDGKFRAVIAHQDPTFANWLDTTGNRAGIILLRWYASNRWHQSDHLPRPMARRVKLEHLKSESTWDSPILSVPERTVVLKERARAALSRYGY